MRYTNIVHLSDLHLKSSDPEKFNQSLILDALVEDLEYIRDSQLRPDCIIFSGDIVQASDDAESNKSAIALISRLAESAGLDTSRVFLCPGNHDASRSVVGPHIPEITAMRKSAQSLNGLNSLAVDHKFIEHVGKSFSNFKSISSSFGTASITSEDALVTQYFIRDVNLAVIAINTAALTGCGLSADVSDDRNLAFPELSLSRALKRVPDGAQVIIVGHHPISYLNETCQSVLQALILEKSDIYACGHLHSASPLTIFGPTGQCTIAQSGSLYGSREWWNGYSIISMINGQPHHRISYRKWHEQRRKFGVASELQDDGVIYSSPESSSFWSTVTPKLDTRLLEKWRAETLSDYLEEDFGTEFFEMCCQGTFVSPDFEREVYIETDNGLEKSSRLETIDFDSLMLSPDNLVVGAQSETGKTTLIRHWAFKLAERSVTLQGWSIPVVMRLSEFKNYIKGNENLVKSKLPGLPNGISAIDLLREGALTIFIDDMDLKSSSAKTAFDELVTKYPTCRFILLTGTVYLQGAGIAPVIVQGVPFSHVRLKQLKASQLLTLIENHGTKDPAQADRLLQRMVQEASSLNVPITPVTGTFFIQIYTEDSSQPLINRANLVERYVEISLEKFAPQELLPSSFDFHNKSDLLSFVAEYMCRNDIYEIAESEFINLITEYMNEFGLRFSSINLLEYFVKAKILQRNGSFVSFRLNAFMEYFAAVRMVGQATFRDWIFDDPRYLSFANEIAFYAAMTRRDQAWLETLFDRFEKTSAEVWDNMPAEVRTGSLIENFVLPMASAKEADVLAVEKKIFEAPLDESDRRAILDGEDPIVPIPTTAVQRQLATDPSERWLGQLTMLSAMLKNMELVPSPLKKKILRSVLHGWLQFLATSMGLVPTLAKNKKLKIAGIEYVVLFSSDMDIAEIARRIFLYMPIASAKLATHHLGTEKLRVQLEEGIGADTDDFSAGQQFMRASILSQLGVDGLDKIVEQAAATFSDKGYLSSVFVRLLSEIVVRFRLPESDLQGIRLVAADAIARIEGKTGQNAARRKGQVIEALTHKRMTLELMDKKS
ncbi:MAG: metallophosphoesterase [Rhizobiaceae bacterium]|nr:MAG: metallophosphoesterase [Rhizobiaceae bacterium]